jgi:hypothetical protein
LLLARGYARDNNLNRILTLVDVSHNYILDPIFQKQNDVALVFTEEI